MTETLAEALEALPHHIKPEARVLPERDPHSLPRAFSRLTKRLQLANLTFHDLRHDVASTLTMAGVPQRTVMAILGHRDPRVTLRYQRLAPDHLKGRMRSLERPAVPVPKASRIGTI